MDIRTAFSFRPFLPRQASAADADEFERQRRCPKFLDLGCVLYDRDCLIRPGPLVCGESSSDIGALTRHRDPRVRTLALVCLFGKEDPKLLPLLQARR
jgi:hypothetical protein